MNEKDNIKKHYELTDNTIEVDGHVLHQIICTEAFRFAYKGDLGGFIEGYQNLGGNGWVFDNAKVYGGAVVIGNGIVSGNATIRNEAQVSGNATVGGNATICNKARVFGNAIVSGDAYISGVLVDIYGNASVFGNATIRGICDIEGIENIGGEAVIDTSKALHINNGFISGDAVINSMTDYITFKNWWSSGRSFTWTRSNDMWRVGCFYGTGKELIAKAYKDSEVSGREYERVVKYVESIKKTYAKKADKPTIFQRLKKLFCTTYGLSIN